MATDKQIEANRLNAQHSTGPRTSEGKSAVRFNALKHGVYAEEPVIIGEDRDRFHDFRESYVLDFDPATSAEATLVTSIVRSAWLLDRFSKIETHMWDFQLDPPCGDPLVRAHAVAYPQFNELQRRLNSAHRNYRADLELLTRLQAARKKCEEIATPSPEPAVAPKRELTLKENVNLLQKLLAFQRKYCARDEPDTEPESPEVVTTEIGFVPANAPQPSNAPPNAPPNDPDFPTPAPLTTT